MLGGDIEAELEEVDIEGVQYHCEAIIIVQNDRRQQPSKVSAVLYTVSGVSCVLEKPAVKFGAHLMGPKLSI